MIRNCEEFGLFDDLKHVNPFEETFRQAIDDKTKTSSIILTTQRSIEAIKCNDEDTLHTPNIFPYNSVICDSKDDTKPADKKATRDSHEEKPPVGLPIQESNKEATQNPSANENKVDVKVEQSLPNEALITDKSLKNKDITLKALRKIYPKPIVVPMIYSTMNPTKEKIRQSLLKLQAINIEETTKINVPINNIEHSFPKHPSVVGFSRAETKQHAIRKKNYIFKGNNANERNREAAKRYRNKQKSLHDALLLRNTQLEDENAILKKQLFYFKKAHANCSVTQNNYDTLPYK